MSGRKCNVEPITWYRFVSKKLAEYVNASSIARCCNFSLPRQSQLNSSSTNVSNVRHSSNHGLDELNTIRAFQKVLDIKLYTTMSTLTPEQYQSLTRNVSIGLLVACPTLALLPPRRLNFYTFALIGLWAGSANHLIKDRTGRSILDRLGNVGGDGLPTEKAREIQRKLREQKLVANKEKSMLEKVWMGDEGEDWKEKRLKKEREALKNGEGYGSLIMDQISEVWRRDKNDGNSTSDVEKKEPGSDNAKSA
jgi:hypothetical protein